MMKESLAETIETNVETSVKKCTATDNDIIVAARQALMIVTTNECEHIRISQPRLGEAMKIASLYLYVFFSWCRRRC